MKNIHLPLSDQRLRKLLHLFLDHVSLQSSSSFHNPLTEWFQLFLFFSTRTASKKQNWDCKQESYLNTEKRVLVRLQRISWLFKERAQNYSVQLKLLSTQNKTSAARGEKMSSDESEFRKFGQNLSLNFARW